ncbi:aspartyl/asparaginyl beta-hydroxylase domain-containing protein [Shewanella woodyi]|uniref:aspartyl/asparaginyl beta-hydroxylase domain-containing protein n=1 Tax=Shewanella woodyi TaxID=60961 RepID=UPI0037488CEC
MKLEHEFYKLPLSFDSEQLQHEISQFDESDWTAHHESFEGNSAIALISVNGTFNNEFKGVMSQTPALKKCTYIQQVIASFGEVISRSRLMRLAPGCEVPLHNDINYHWHKRVRIHIPITTNDLVVFHCANQQVNMKKGDCWIFDSWKYHKVVNNSDEMRVHLVIDTIGSSRFWEMVRERSLVVGHDVDVDVDVEMKINHHTFNLEQETQICTENINFPVIMPPSEVKGLTDELTSQIKSYGCNQLEKQTFIRNIQDFSLDWQENWSKYGDSQEGWRHYHELRQRVLASIASLEKLVLVDSQTSAMNVFIHLIVGPSMNTELEKMPPYVSNTTSSKSISEVKKTTTTNF